MHILPHDMPIEGTGEARLESLVDPALENLSLRIWVNIRIVIMGIYSC